MRNDSGRQWYYVGWWLRSTLTPGVSDERNDSMCFILSLQLPPMSEHLLTVEHLLRMIANDS